MKYLSQTLDIGNGQVIRGPLDSSFTNLTDAINKIIPFLVTIASIILFFALVAGGYSMMTSQGNPEKVKSARAKITTGIIGFVLLIVSYVIVKLIANIFGLGGGLF